MTRPLHQRDDADLATALRDAGRALPGARRDIAAALTPERLGTGRRRSPRRRTRRSLVLAAALLVVIAGSALAAGVVPGVDLRTSDQRVDTTRPALIDDAAFLGARTTLADARASVDIPVRVPDLPAAPQVYVADDRRVSLVYPAADGLPPVDGTSAGLVVTQFAGRPDDVVLRKAVGPDAEVSPVDVGGATGWWITGAHTVATVTPDGGVAPQDVRYADRTLLWSVDGVTLRLEADVGRARAVELAASMR